MDIQVGMLMLALMNFTLPSAKATLQPPEWALVALVKAAESGEQSGQPWRQVCQRYCVELGGAIVLNKVMPVSPQPHL